MLAIIISAAITFIITVIAVGFIYRFALRKNIVAKVNHRSMHKGRVPLLGGGSIIFGFFIGISILLILAPKIGKDYLSFIAPMLFGGSLIGVTGFIDDVFNLKPLSKLLLQFFSAFVVVVIGGLNIEIINLGFMTLKFGAFSSIITMIWIVAMTNAINLIDGLDGLASGISAMSFFTLFILSTFSPIQTQNPFVAAMSFIMLVSTLAFLIFNFPPAKIFLGDTGSLFLGYMIGVLAVSQYKNAAFFSLVMPLLVIALPLLDMISATLRRLLRKQSPGTADREHLHHKIYDSLQDTKHAILILYAVNAFFCFIAIIYFTADIGRGIGYFLIFIAILAVDFIIEYFGLINKKYRPLLEAYQIIHNVFSKGGKNEKN
ncbi:MAG: MraY family glycosyltransferase [Culicoidibacterales bacterium]